MTRTATKLLPSVSFSEIDAFRMCPHKWWLGYKERFKAPTTGIALARGSLWHEILATHYKGKGTPNKKTIAKLLFDENGDQSEIQAICDWLYDYYPQKWKADDAKWTVKAIEQKLSHRMPGQPFRLNGVLDLVVVEGRKLWLVDHKTHGQMPDARKLELIDQMPLYVWLLRKMDKPVHGVIYNAARTYRWKDELRKPEFERFYLHVTDDMAAEVVREAALTVERMKAYTDWKTAERNTGEHCLYMCDYTEPCLAGRKGSDEEQFLIDKGFLREAY